VNIGIIGAGAIANKMAKTINSLEGFNTYAIASRSLEKAKAFQQKYAFDVAYGSYDDLYNDNQVDLIYIATPHSFHYKQMKEAILHHKNVLCEKAFTLNAKEAKEIRELASKEGVYIAEALWTSYMPFNDLLKNLLMDEKVTSFTSNFVVPIMKKERLAKKELGGGALLDIGVYPLSFALRTLGFNYDSVEVESVELTNEDVDSKEVIILNYGDLKAKCVVDATTPFNLSTKIETTNKRIFIDSVNCPNYIKVKQKGKLFAKKYRVTPKYSGFEYQLEEAKKQIEAKELQSKLWDMDKTVALMELCDKINIEMRK